MMPYHRLAVGRSDATILALGPTDAIHRELSNWSLRPLQRPEDAKTHHDLARTLSDELYQLNVRVAFAPNVAAMSGKVISPESLTDRICLGEADLYRNQHVPADGVFLKHGEAFVMSAAGCPVILASGGGYFIAAHAGRDSLIDRDTVIGVLDRPDASVVNSIICELSQRGVSTSDIIMTMQFAIPAEAFEHAADHKTYGEYNRALAAFVDERWPDSIVRKGGRTFLDLQQVFLEQARQAGVRRVWTERSLDQFPHLAHTRDGAAADRRNLFIVRRDA